MIDGIPNRPLYFYQKDIIGCEDMKCRKLRFWDLWIVLEVFGIVIDGFPFRRSSRSSPASGIRPLETKEPTGRCFGVVYSGIMPFKYAALGIHTAMEPVGITAFMNHLLVHHCRTPCQGLQARWASVGLPRRLCVFEWGIWMYLEGWRTRLQHGKRIKIGSSHRENRD